MEERRNGNDDGGGAGGGIREIGFVQKGTVIVCDGLLKASMGSAL